jgi:hypothetical protein
MISDRIENLIIVLNDFSRKIVMSLTSWLQGEMPKPSSKRKLPKRKFKKANSQKSYDWYVVDSESVWHCYLCRNAKFDTAYARGHHILEKL